MEAPDTAFASAERAAAETLRWQCEFVNRLPHVAEVLNALPILTVILNSHRQIIFANKAFAQFIGACEDLLASSSIGQRSGEALGCVHSKEGRGGCGTTVSCRTCGSVLAILNSQKGNASVQECRMLRDAVKGAGAVDLRVSARPLQIEDQHFTVLSVEDISADKRRQAMERIFFHDVLNTAIGMEGLAGLLAEAQSANPEFQSLAKLICFSAGQLTDEINAQRTLSAAERSDLAASPQRVELKSFLEQIAQCYAPHDTARERSIRVLAQAELPAVETDPSLLRRVVLNLLKNALEASKKGETVTFSVSSERHSVHIRAHNPAVMSDEVKAQIFSRSFSTRGPGRGFGTYSVKLLTERYLSGQVSFESAAPAGTTFTVTLPLKWHKPAAGLSR